MDVVVVPSSPKAGLRRRLRNLPANPWFAYLTLLVLQVGVVAVAWRDRDLPFGDTSVYFLHAWNWRTHGEVNIAAAPLYTAYYGSLMFLTQDPYAVTLLHRYLIVCAAMLLVLATFRRLLPAGLAWWLGVWWAVLPINFNTLYEVHLFAFLPVACAWLAALAFPGPRGRGLCLGIFCAATVLVRNELGLACLLYGAYCLFAEWRDVRAGLSGRWRSRLPAYALPLLAAGCLCAFFYWRSSVKYPELQTWVTRKHTLNMSQVFTWGYQQRHPQAANASPWDEFQEVMQQHFGQPDGLTLWQMALRNPRAVGQHFLWNLSLVPGGVQMLLLNAMSGTRNPDYIAVNGASRKALVLSIGLAALWLAGLYRLLRDRRTCWEYWRPHASGWCAMLAMAAVAVIIILTQRPRPSYLFPVTVMLMTWTGVCLCTLWPIVRFARPSSLASRALFLAPCLPLVMIAVCVGVPMAQAWKTRNVPPRPQPMRTYVERLQPFADLLRRPETRLLQRDCTFEVLSYVGKRTEMLAANRDISDQPPDYRVFRHWPHGMPLGTFLEEHGITLALLDEGLLYDLERERAGDGLEFVTDSTVSNWKLLASEDTPGKRWRLYQLPPVPSAQQNPESVKASSRLAIRR